MRLGASIGLAAGLVAGVLASPAWAGWCYYNNGLSFRACDNVRNPVAAGEVYFASVPSTAQLEAAFPGYASTIGPATALAGFKSAVAAGLAITSAGTPALNGTYPVDPASLAVTLMTQEQLYINTAGTFSNGLSTREWADLAGTYHLFPSTAEFTAFSEAIGKYYDGLETALATVQAGGAWAPPTASAGIP